MCNKLNSVYWAFLIWVNYITVCTLHFCVTRFEGKISDLIDSNSGSAPTPKSGGPDLSLPPHLMLCPWQAGGIQATRWWWLHYCRLAMNRVCNKTMRESWKRLQRRRGVESGESLCPALEFFLTSEWKMGRSGAFWVLILQTNFLQIVPWIFKTVPPPENYYTLSESIIGHLRAHSATWICVGVHAPSRRRYAPPSGPAKLKPTCYQQNCSGLLCHKRRKSLFSIIVLWLWLLQQSTGWTTVMNHSRISTNLGILDHFK